MRDRTRTVTWAITAICVVAAAVELSGLHWLRAIAFLGAACVPIVVQLPWRKQVAFAVVAVLLSTTLTLLGALGLDLYLHHWYATSGGYNVWGYRGAVVEAKTPGEHRLVMLGGSVAFGYGVQVDQTIPAYLQQFIAQARPRSPAKVINLGWNSEGAYSFLFTLKDYAHLNYDAAILYSGYNDWLYNNQVFRHQSAIFRATGYLSMLQTVPMGNWLRIRDLSRLGDQVVFKPNLADRSSTEAVQTALRVSQAVERQLGKLVPEPVPESVMAAGACGERWDYYCGSVQRAVDFARQEGKEVFVVTEPYAVRASAGGPAGRAIYGWQYHVEQQRILANMLAVKYAKDKRVHYVNMGPAVDLNDPELCYDGLHLTSKGNRQLASRLAPEILNAWSW